MLELLPALAGQVYVPEVPEISDLASDRWSVPQCLSGLVDSDEVCCLMPHEIVARGISKVRHAI